MHEKSDAGKWRAVVFDFDGTLIDSYGAIAASVNHVRALHGLPPLGETEVRKHVGRGPEHLIKHTVGDRDIPADLQRYREHHPSVMRSLTHLLPGASEALRAVRDAGLQTAICSNKPRPFTEAILKSLAIDGLIDAVVGPEDAPRPKPAPDMLIAVMQRLRVRPDQTLYMGDMTVDIETARSAGVAVWVVPTGSSTRQELKHAGPDRILDNLDELADLFAA
jgi:phosphoglycolate phosphatase